MGQVNLLLQQWLLPVMGVGAVLSFQKKLLFSNKNTGMHPEKQNKKRKASTQEAGIQLQSVLLLKMNVCHTWNFYSYCY